MVLMKAGVYQIILYKNTVKPSVSFKMERKHTRRLKGSTDCCQYFKLCESKLLCPVF